MRPPNRGRIPFILYLSFSIEDLSDKRRVGLFGEGADDGRHEQGEDRGDGAGVHRGAVPGDGGEGALHQRGDQHGAGKTYDASGDGAGLGVFLPSAL